MLNSRRQHNTLKVTPTVQKPKEVSQEGSKSTLMLLVARLGMDENKMLPGTYEIYLCWYMDLHHQRAKSYPR